MWKYYQKSFIENFKENISRLYRKYHRESVQRAGQIYVLWSSSTLVQITFPSPTAVSPQRGYLIFQSFHFFGCKMIVTILCM